MLRITFPVLCVGKIYVAIAAKTANRKDALVFGGNINYSIRKDQSHKWRRHMVGYCRLTLKKSVIHGETSIKRVGCPPTDRRNLCAVNLKTTPCYQAVAASWQHKFCQHIKPEMLRITC